MKVTNEQYAEALHQALESVSPKDHNAVINNFIDALKANNDLNRYEQIIETYERMDRQRRGVKDVEATFARETKINSELLEQLNSIVGADVEVRTKIDETIIGGIILRINEDTLIDASAQGHLNRLKDQLTQ